MSRFNKNGDNLSKAGEKEWLKAVATPVEEKSAEEAPPADDNAKKRRGLKLGRTKKGDNNG